jgi:D-alanyl-D-alanine carboxypeptidase/D-alanyl-D-alanine-endopeptidase (penicillin-binding protein 4)
MLERRGVSVVLSGEGDAEGEPVLASVQSAPLSEIVEELLTTSDNVTAELLLKEIGLAATGVGSTAAGVSVIADRLASWGVSTEGLALYDGSGLSSDNRISCSTLVGVLAHLGGTGPVFDGLPVAGETGTLADYFEGTPVEGELRAKTGSLAEARALSGYFPAADGSMLEFSFLVNGEGAKGRSERLWDELAAALDSYPQGPSAEALAPAAPSA